MGGLANRHCHDVIQTKRQPDYRDQDINRPCQFGIFLALSNSQRQGNYRQHDNQIPPPKGKPGQAITPQPGRAGALHHVVAGSHQGTAAKCKNYRIGMQGAQTPKGNFRDKV